jgi:hypothetical protein
VADTEAVATTLDLSAGPTVGAVEAVVEVVEAEEVVGDQDQV